MPSFVIRSPDFTNPAFLVGEEHRADLIVEEDDAEPDAELEPGFEADDDEEERIELRPPPDPEEIIPKPAPRLK